MPVVADAEIVRSTPDVGVRVTVGVDAAVSANHHVCVEACLTLCNKSVDDSVRIGVLLT
jgi:hypothetical protein